MKDTDKLLLRDWGAANPGHLLSANLQSLPKASPSSCRSL